MSGLILDPPVVERNSAGFLIRCAYDGNRALTVTIDAPVNVLDRLSPTVAPFVPIAMLVAGSEGRDLIVRGALEPLHWTKLTCEFWPLMRRLFGFPDVNLQSDNTGNPHGLVRRLAGAIKAPLDGVALMFSGGVDSFYSLQQLRRVGVFPGWLLNINAGAHDYDRACWNDRIANVKKVGNMIGVQTITIDTDFHENFRVEHIRCHVVRNLCASFTLAPAITRFVYSSGGAFEEISYADGASDIDVISHAVCQPMTPPGLELALLGWDATRLEKTRVVASDALCQSHLDVCTNQSYQAAAKSGQFRNCSQCPKCLCTMLMLEHHGHLDLFASQFDVTEFRARRSEWIAVLAASPNWWNRDVLRLLNVR